MFFYVTQRDQYCVTLVVPTSILKLSTVSDMPRSAHSSISSSADDSSSNHWSYDSTLSSSLSSASSSSDSSDDAAQNESAVPLRSSCRNVAPGGRVRVPIAARHAPIVGPMSVSGSPHQSRSRFVDVASAWSGAPATGWRTPAFSSPGASGSPPTSPMEQVHSRRLSLEVVGGSGSCAGFEGIASSTLTVAPPIEGTGGAVVQWSQLLLRLTPDVVRLICSYLPTANILLGVVPVCNALRTALCGSRNNPQTAEHFWKERWGLSYRRALPQRVYSTNRLVTRGLGDDPPVHAHLQRLVCDATVPWAEKHSRLEALSDMATGSHGIDRHQRTQHYLDIRGGRPVMSAEPSRLKVIRITDNGLEPHPPDTVSMAMIADHVAYALSSCYLNGYATPQQKTAEELPSFRASVGTGAATAERPGFGVILPLYHHLGVERGLLHGEVASQLDEDCKRLGYMEAPTAPLPNSDDLRPVRPYYAREDLLTYWWILEHAQLSDVKHYAWSEETKLAVCATILSPVSGRAAEVRFYAGALQGSIPRFYVKCVMAAASSLPSEDIVDNFPDAAELFCGGFGRVEVDVAPRVKRAHFEQLRNVLGLRSEFPLTLLWNIVCGATGCVSTLTQQNNAFLMSYERQTFADVAAATLGDGN
jgi:hypothetical protein